MSSRPSSAPVYDMESCKYVLMYYGDICRHMFSSVCDNWKIKLLIISSLSTSLVLVLQTHTHSTHTYVICALLTVFVHALIVDECQCRPMSCQ